MNKNDSIFTFLKIEYNHQLEEFLYSKFFGDKIKELVKEHQIDFIKFEADNSLKRTKSIDQSKSKSNSEQGKKENIYYINISSIVRIKSGDQIRLARINGIELNTGIYEFMLYNNLEQMIKHKTINNKKWMYYYYTLNVLLKNNVERANRYIIEIIQCFIANYEKDIDLLYVLKNAVEYIEKNTSLLKYSDLCLYEHQKEIYTIVRSIKPKLILYTAPTGTGKTLSPIGLSKQYKIIFC